MAPNVVESTVTSEISEPEKKPYKVEIVWRNVILFSYLHVAAVYGLYILIFYAKWNSLFWFLALYLMAGLGITAGVHRLWTHRAYKAKYPLQILLAIFNLLAFENSIYEWARDHRVHHKYSDSNADPHNAKRGFFFSHIGWLLCRKHPDVKEKGKGIDLSDLHANPIVMFQHRYFKILMPLTCFIIPTLIPWYFWNESLINSWYLTLFRYCFVLHMTWCVNSVAHMWGMKPYDLSILPMENPGVAIIAFGEGWHNYHHVFPWDYKTSELGDYRMNITTAFIDFMVKIGQAYDCKTVSANVITDRMKRTGASAGAMIKTNPSEERIYPWGWGDKIETECINGDGILKKSE